MVLVTIEPDLTWYDADDKPVTVIDAKYKCKSKPAAGQERTRICSA